MRKPLHYIASLAITVLILNACAPQKTALQNIQNTGVIHVLTRNSSTAYSLGPQGPEGMEYELVKAFAKYLGVSLKINTEDNLENILKRVENNNVDFAAAGLTVTPEREKLLRFAESYQSITQQLVYNRNIPRPKTLSELDGGMMEVVANSSHVEKLVQLKITHPSLIWEENKEADSSELLNLVAERLIDYTIADSNEVLLMRRFYPKLGIAFNISKRQKLAWAFSKSSDDSLFNAANAFLSSYKKSGQLAQLIKRNYNHARKYDYAGTPTYLGHVRNRLPDYREMFEQAAELNELDWQLLAAVAYQESHWNPRAVSPTGVKGIMMLTNLTAQELGIKKRTDPLQSIEGGARYLRKLFGKFSSEMDKQDRLWFTLAAYNVGLGHVKDAQIITQRRGGNPDKWVDVKESLPLLSRRRWHTKTRHGYARGKEPVRYVENIRSYYDILHWHFAKENQQKFQDKKIAYVSPVL